MVWLTALLIGLVQGICRFLPVSASGHMSVIVNLFGLNYIRENNMLFEALMHLAAFGAIMTIYGRDFAAIIRDTIEYAKTPIRDKNTEKLPLNVRTASMVGIGIAPILIPLFMQKAFKALYLKTGFVALGLVITGVLLWAACQVSEGKRSVKSMSVATAALTGVANAISALPGMSLFASAYCMSVTNEFKQTNAVRFAYMIMAPIYLLAGIIEALVSLNSGMDFSYIWMYLAGAAVTYVSSYAAILFFRYILERKKLINVALYLFGIGSIALILSIFM